MRLNIAGYFKGITLFLLLWMTAHAAAQTEDRIPLLEAIQHLEETFQVRFSYALDDIQGVEVSYKNLETLESELEGFQSEIPFKFNRISERYISVIKAGTGFRCARLLDASSGEALENATVVAVDDNFATITNEDGYFYVPESISTDSYQIRFLGFEPMLISASELTSDCPTILMQTQIAELEPVLIRNYLVSGLEKSGNGSIEINTNRFGLLPGQIENDVLQIIQAVPGIQSIDETISNINIRSGTNDENLILWEDIRLYQSGHFFGLISAFNPDITKQVTIYKNGAPARYGEGVSGVIAMRSDNDVASEFEAGVGSNMINGGFFVITPITSNFSIQLSGRRSINDLWESPVYSSYSERIFQDTEITNTEDGNPGFTIETEEDFEFYDLSLKALWDLGENDKLRINLLGINNKFTFSETILETEFSKNNELDEESLLGGISWWHYWSVAFNTTVMTYATAYNRTALNRNILTTQEVFQENEVLETGVKLDANLKFNAEWELIGGYQFSELGISNTQDVNLPRFRDFDKDVLRTHALHTGVRYTNIGKTTAATLTARANYYDKYEEYYIEPRLSIYQSITSGLGIEVQGEMKSQTATQRINFDSDFLGLEKRRWVLANGEDIPVIESRQASLGLIFDKQGWFINLEGYLKQVDGITTSNQGFQNQFQFVQSSGSYEATGAEVVINKRNAKYSVWGSYTYLNSTYTFEDLDPSEFPHNLDVTHTVNVAGTLNLRNLKLGGGINWRTGKPFTFPVEGDEIVGPLFSETIQYDEPNSSRLPDYMRVDVSAEYFWEVSDAIDLKLNVALLNVLDKANSLNVRYAIIDDGNGQKRVNRVEQFSLGLTPNFSFQLLF